jgi:hypothetical protein
MKLLILGLAGLAILLGAGALAVVWLTRWLATRAAEGLSGEELDAGLAIPMRDGSTRRTPRPPAG